VTLFDSSSAVSPFDRARRPTTFYSPSIEAMSVHCTVSTISGGYLSKSQISYLYVYLAPQLPLISTLT